METRQRETYQRSPSETEMQRTGRETYETAGGYGQQSTETGAQQPSLKERMESTFTGRTAEEQARHDRSREYQSETGTGTGMGAGAGAGAGAGSLGDSMRSTFSSRPSLERPTVGEQVKGMLSGRSAEEQRAYEQGRRYETGTGREQRYDTREQRYEQGREQGRERGYGTETGREQPSFVERVEATFTGRTAQEQHEHDARQRRERESQREYEQRSRGSSSQPGLMSQLGSTMTGLTGGVFGTETGTPKRSLKQRMRESIHEIRTNMTGRTGTGETYTPMERSSYTTTGSEYGRRAGTGTAY